ncbi:hypothetical protein [Staphylococcus shinii]|uniref:hypothetical protein n=2 Tax=Staphylococcus shinii TaxID=2912228 RepID=UPI003F580232
MAEYITMNKSIDKSDEYENISISKVVPNNHLLRKGDVILQDTTLICTAMNLKKLQYG